MCKYLRSFNKSLRSGFSGALFDGVDGSIEGGLFSLFVN